MLREETRFLDLDVVAQQIPDAGQRSVFLEALTCYHAGSHRAAVILAWSAAAECLDQRLGQLASEGDGEANTQISHLAGFRGQAAFEEQLIGSARKCDLVDDYEEKCLRFARDTRSQSAHPTGTVPSAEAVRHILHVCSQMVLCRESYRGMSFIRDIVTSRLGDPLFLPVDEKRREHCRALAAQVPRRLWPQFLKVASENWTAPMPSTWQSNALTFFGELLAESDNDGARTIAEAALALESRDTEFFALLVGLDERVGLLFAEHVRAQARARLRAANTRQITGESVHAWAVICASDGMEAEDSRLLSDKLAPLARHLAKEAAFIAACRAQVLAVLDTMTREDATSSHAALALPHLCGTALADGGDPRVASIIRQVLTRSVHDNAFGEVVASAGGWSASFLEQFLLLAEEYVLLFDEDQPDFVNYLFDAAEALAAVLPTEAPTQFGDVVRRVLDGSLQPEWQAPESEVGAQVRLRARSLLGRARSALGASADAVEKALDDADARDAAEAQADEQEDDAPATENT